MGERGSTARRLLVALLVALVVGVGMLVPAFVRLRATAAEELQTRRAVVSLEAFADLAARARDAAPRAVTLWTQHAPELRAMRLVDLGERSLVASTDPADRQRGEPPRRLVRDEKPLFDLGQKLRAAVEGNASGAAAREPEIAVETLPDGALRLSSPWTVGGEVVGIAQVDLSRAARPAPTRWWLAALAVLLPVLLLAAAALLVRGRSRALALLATLLLVAGVGGYAARESRALGAERRAATAALAADVQTKAARAESVLVALGARAHEPLHPEQWDADLYRRSRGELGNGAAQQARLADSAHRAAARGWRLGALALLVALVLFGFGGSGAAVRSWRSFVKHRVAYAYAAPALVGMTVLVFFPFLYGIALGFTDANIYNTEKSLPQIFVGFDNFVDILSDVHVVTATAQGHAVNYHNFYWTLGFNVVWTVCNVTIGVTAGLLLALILNTSGLALRPIYRVIFILPWAMPNYITALIWKGMFHRQFGVINQVLQMVGLSPVSWFARPLTSFATVLATNGWLSFPFMMVISLGALQSIPADLYEAARVDGASRWQQFRFVTLPSLRPALVPAVIVSVIWTFNMFNIIFLVSEGEPGGATEILITQAYKIAFQQYRYGYAAAYSTIIFLILLVYGTWQNRATKATEAIA